MISFIAALIFLALALVAMVMQKTYYYLPERELRRQAEAHDPLATVLWQAAAYGAALRVLLWAVIIVGAGVGLVLLSTVAPTVLAIIAVGLLLLFTFAWLPNTKLTSFGGRLTVWATPPLVWLLNHLYPALNWLHQQARHFAEAGHTGLFQREDLLDLLEQQKKQPDNRISDDELDMARAALSFGTHHVRDILVPRQQVKTIAAKEDLGPITLDELHKSRHTRFPVYGSKPDDIVGTLYLHDVVEHKDKAARRKVEDIMQPHVFYVHESDSLVEALHTFYQTKHPLFIVVNSFDEYVGIITLEDILAQVIGQPIIQALDQPDSRKEVAARHPKKVVTEEPKTEPATDPESKPAAAKVADDTPESV